MKTEQKKARRQARKERRTQAQQHDVEFTSEVKQTEQQPIVIENGKPGLFPRFLGAVMAYLGRLLGEFRGSSDLILAKVKPVRRFLNAQNVRIMWGVATAVCGLTACALWSPVWLGLYVGLITLYVFLDPMFQVAAATAAPFVMGYTRIEAGVVYCWTLSRAFRIWAARKIEAMKAKADKPKPVEEPEASSPTEESVTS